MGLTGFSYQNLAASWVILLKKSSLRLRDYFSKFSNSSSSLVLECREGLLKVLFSMILCLSDYFQLGVMSRESSLLVLLAPVQLKTSRLGAKWVVLMELASFWLAIAGFELIIKLASIVIKLFISYYTHVFQGMPGQRLGQIYNLQQTMSDGQQGDSSSQNPMQRLTKKLKSDTISVNLDPQIDITALAVQRYSDLKSNYNFVSFQEADKSKHYANCKTESFSLPINDFNEEMYKFRRHGYCADPDTATKSLVFSSKLKELRDKSEVQGQTIDENHPEFLEKLYQQTTSKSKKQLTKKYKSMRNKDDSEVINRGPWAGYGENLYNGALTEEQKQQLAKAEQTKQIRLEEAKIQERNFEPYSIFHWGSYEDYKGLSYVEPPVDYRRGGQNCFLPKKEVFSWVGSNKEGFQVVRFFPKVGHFFLLGTPEGKVHLFDIVKNKTNAHTYIGHAKAVRDVQFAHDGKNFLSCGFDNKVLNWDTEYGKVNATFNLKRIPFTLKFHPSEYHPNIFLCGSSSKKIYQFDLRTGTKTMEYNQHLGTVNTLTFIQQNKFVSSSDDKKLFIWEYGVPVVTRHVSQPEMHTITSTAMHPSGQFFAGQSSDNQIVIYENKGGNFRRLRAKKFASHYCAGYACALDFSYDGQFLISGDERGKFYCYDWKTSKVYRILEGHAGACIGLQWHPSQPTTVVTCGWQGMVKLWQ